MFLVTILFLAFLAFVGYSGASPGAIMGSAAALLVIGSLIGFILMLMSRA
jgi:hypothetical protein